MELRSGIDENGILLILEVNKETNEVGSCYPVRVVTPSDIESLIESLLSLAVEYPFEYKNEVSH